MQQRNPVTPGAQTWKVRERCPGTEALAIISDKWKASIIAILGEVRGPLRFAAIQRMLVPVSRKVLSAALHELDTDGIVNRVVYAEVPPRVEYSLTAHGKQLLPILASLHAWRSASIDGEDRLAGEPPVAQPLG